MKRILKNESGATAIEYGLIVALILIVVLYLFAASNADENLSVVQYEHAKTLANDPAVKPIYDKAIADNLLTLEEYQEIQIAAKNANKK